MRIRLLAVTATAFVFVCGVAAAQTATSVKVDVRDADLDMKYVDRQHLDDLALGAVFLATGGGGDPHLPRLIADQALKQYGPVELLPPENVADNLFVVPVGSVGAPTVSLELLPSVDEAANTVRAYEKFVGRKADAIASFEIGGGNSLVPLVAAAALGVPVIDGDGMAVRRRGSRGSRDLRRGREPDAHRHSDRARR